MSPKTQNSAPLLLSIILPAYNEGANIHANILRICEALQGHHFEVIVVDDGSQDNTHDEAQRASLDGYPIQTIRQDANRGKGATLFHGFEFTSGERVAFLDADLEIAPEYLLQLMQVMDESGADVVAGVKDADDNQFPWVRRMMSSLYRRIVAFLFGLSITDTQTGIKFFKREVLAATVPRLKVSRFAFDIELLVAASRFGFTIEIGRAHV